MPFHMAEYMCVACLHQKIQRFCLPAGYLCYRRLLVKLCIHIREFPHACQKSACAALMQCHGIFRKQDKYCLIHNLSFLLLTADGQISPCVLLSCLTDLRHRTYIAPRCTIGTQTVAPSSISACVAIPGFFCGYVSCSFLVMRFFVVCRSMFASSARSRLYTRNTFPSTAGVGASKQIDAIAPAV